MSRPSRTVNRAEEPVDDDLPTYTPRRHSSTSSRSQTEHSYHLKNRNDQPWLTLRVNSQATRAQSLPFFFKDDTVTGSVDLNLVKSDHIQAVVLKVRSMNTSQWLFSN
jgi:hypothetical protein